MEQEIRLYNKAGKMVWNESTNDGKAIELANKIMSSNPKLRAVSFVVADWNEELMDYVVNKV